MLADNQAKNKMQNKNLIFKQIIMNGKISRIELAKLTGLTKMSVTNLVNELCEDGLICETTEEKNHAIGRNPIMLVANKEKRLIGIYINRDYIEVLAGEIGGKILETQRIILSEKGTEKIINMHITECIDDLIKKYKNIIGIGVSSIGMIHSHKKITFGGHDFFEFGKYDICEYLSKKYNLPIYADNDMNTSALAEKYWGYAKNKMNYIYIGAAKGLGSGIVINGKLNDRIIGEIGHVSVDINGKKCYCGNRGCLEMYASISEDYDGKNSDEICRYIAAGAVTLMNLFNPEAIYFGHRITLLGENAPEIIKKYMSQAYITRFDNDIDMRFSKFGKNSPSYGALAIFIENHIF